MAKRDKVEKKPILGRQIKRGLKPSQLFILGFVVIVMGYALWPRMSEKTVLSSQQTGDSKEGIRTARIYPNPAYALNTLEVRLNDRYWMLQDSLTYRWYRNGQAIPTANQSSLGPEKFKKGDEIYAEVSLKDPRGFKDAYRTPSTRIQNTPPRILSASTVLQSSTAHAITAQVQSIDADGDQVEHIFSWYKNGEKLAGESQPTMDPSHFQRGDEIHAEIVADDGEDRSHPVKSAPLTFENVPPRISSNPPQRLTEDRRFIYQLKIEDADGDSITFELVQAPLGMTISRTGRIEWLPPPKETGKRSYTVEVIARDPVGGEVSQIFEISLSGVKEVQEE